MGSGKPSRLRSESQPSNVIDSSNLSPPNGTSSPAFIRSRDNASSKDNTKQIRVSNVEGNNGSADSNKTWPGKFVVFNFEEFWNRSRRGGTDKDKERLVRTFGELGYDVAEPFQDLPKVNVLEELRKLALENYSRHRLLCCVFLTHGEEGRICCTDDGTIRIHEILSYFNDKNCATLRDKPKIFIFQACQGSKMNSGVNVNTNVGTEEWFLQQKQFQHENNQKNGGESAANKGLKFYTSPPFKNFIIAHSTFPGQVSWRNQENGSYFIQTLCDVIRDDDVTSDVMTLLMKTSRHIAYDFRSNTDQDKEFLQIPCTTSTVSYKVYLNGETSHRQQPISSPTSRQALTKSRASF